LVCRPHVRHHFDCPSRHLLRVVVRVLLHARRLSSCHKANLQCWIGSILPLTADCQWAFEIPIGCDYGRTGGQTRLSVQVEARSLIWKDHGVVAVVWLAPWAMRAISIARLSDVCQRIRAWDLTLTVCHELSVRMSGSRRY
jgi:hypothetical protein